MYRVIGADGQVYGPVDLQTLQRWCQEGRITPDSNLIDPQSGQVFSAQHVPQLAGFFQRPAYSPPPGPSNPYGSPYTQGPFPQNSPYGAYQRPYLGAVSSKSKLTAALLAFFFGVLGVHRFYLGHTTTGLIMLALTLGTCWFGGSTLVGIWALVDFILILTGSLKDSNGAELS